MSSLAVKLRGRPKIKPPCVWCDQTDPAEQYLLPVESGMKTFCSQSCLLQYRKCYNKGACATCDNPIRNPVKLSLSENETKTFCSTTCMNEYEKKRLNEDIKKKGDKVNNRTSNNEHPLSPTFYKTNVQFTDWDSYLKETTSEAAPSHCFKQYVDPPANNFETGMKLEAKDNRNSTSTCLATVVEKLGPRLRLRLDGGDNSNDFWRLVDSNEISVYGTAEKKRGMLQPPLGFRQNASSYNSFLKKALNGATFAPSHLFVPEPRKPQKNLFKPGQKLEAVDPHCPNYISVATVDKVENDEISIIFDGCNKSYGHSCKYYSRDIFPVGWCEKSDHPLQHGRKITVPSKSKMRTQNMSPMTFPIEDASQTNDVIQNVSVSAPSSHVTLIEADTSTVIPKAESSSCTSTSSDCGSISTQTEDDVKNSSYHQKQVTACIVKKSDGKVLITEQEAATSTTPTEMCPKVKLPQKTTDWSIENVISYISDSDPQLSVHADLFRRHEIDGKALVLLSYETMMKYMGLKLGPALKICYFVKNRRHEHC